MRKDESQELDKAVETRALLCILELGNEQIAAGKVYPAHEVFEDILRNRNKRLRFEKDLIPPD